MIEFVVEVLKSQLSTFSPNFTIIANVNTWKKPRPDCLFITNYNVYNSRVRDHAGPQFNPWICNLRYTPELALSIIAEIIAEMIESRARSSLASRKETKCLR